MKRPGKSLSALIFTFLFLSTALANSTDHRIRLVPHFLKGATLRYNIETSASADQHTNGPVIDTQGATQFKQTTSFLVRLDVLGVRNPQGQNDAGSVVRFRATFEKSQADSTTNAAAPDQNSADDAIDKLQGHSFEFSLGTNGEVSDLKGLDEITANRAAAQAALAWVHVLADAGSFPSEGIELGQKWSTEHPVSGFPLTGMIWRSESTYIRNEPCATPARAATAPVKPSATEEACAVILTHFEMSRHGSERSDATPDDYRQNGLRTSGKWTVSGESLNSISVTEGFLVSSTQTATQDMDYEIVSATSGSRIHQVGQTKTQTEINLVRESVAAH
jgi:hypothetical protein